MAAAEEVVPTEWWSAIASGHAIAIQAPWIFAATKSTVVAYVAFAGFDRKAKVVWNNTDCARPLTHARAVPLGIVSP